MTPPTPFNETWIVINVVDSNLNLIWQKYIGGDQFYHLYSLQVLDDGSTLLVGQTNDFLNGGVVTSLFIAKIVPNGEFLSNHDIPQNIMEVKVYPNPGRDFFMLDIQLSGQNHLLELYNLNGQLCHTQTINNGSNRINTQTLAKGMYIYKIAVDGKVVLSERWVKE